MKKRCICGHVASESSGIVQELFRSSIVSAVMLRQLRSQDAATSIRLSDQRDEFQLWEVRPKREVWEHRSARKEIGLGLNSDQRNEVKRKGRLSNAAGLAILGTLRRTRGPKARSGLPRDVERAPGRPLGRQSGRSGPCVSASTERRRAVRRVDAQDKFQVTGSEQESQRRYRVHRAPER